MEDAVAAPPPTEISEIKARRFGFYQTSNTNKIRSLKKRIAARYSLNNSSRRRRFNTASDLTKESIVVSEARNLIDIYLDMNELYKPHSLNERNRIDQVISALKTFRDVNEIYDYDGLLDSLERIRKQLHFESIYKFGGKRKTRKQKRNTRRS
jgi:hypothetical protein